jgi:hypothetical protein
MGNQEISMRKLFLIVVCLLVVFATADRVSAQGEAITLDTVYGLYGVDTVEAGQDVQFWLRFTNPSINKYDISSGFKITSPDGATWDTTIGDTLTFDGTVLLPAANFTFGYNINHYSTEGTGPDTIGFFAAGLASAVKMPAGFDSVPVSVTAKFSTLDAAGMTICIDSVSFFPPGGNWKWVTGSTTVFPTWDGEQCYLIFDPNAADVREIGDGELPDDFSLSQNYPNPFNPTTTITFSLPVLSSVNLSVYNVLGQKVRTLVDQDLAAGTWEETWDGTTDGGTTVSSGLYFYKLETEEYVSTKKMVFLK